MHKFFTILEGCPKFIHSLLQQGKQQQGAKQWWGSMWQGNRAVWPPTLCPYTTSLCGCVPWHLSSLQCLCLLQFPPQLLPVLCPCLHTAIPQCLPPPTTYPMDPGLSPGAAHVMKHLGLEAVVAAAARGQATWDRSWGQRQLGGRRLQGANQQLQLQLWTETGTGAEPGVGDAAIACPLSLLALESKMRGTSPCWMGKKTLFWIWINLVSEISNKKTKTNKWKSNQNSTSVDDMGPYITPLWQTLARQDQGFIMKWHDTIQREGNKSGI